MLYVKKLFTERGLRLHINNYVRGQPTGKHAELTIAQHKEYRDSLAE